jgi:hypothetical protein
MWNVLGNYYGNIDSLRRAVFVIPVTAAQKKILDSLAGQYTREPPYDYAFLGMRCASATYDVLQAAGITTNTCTTRIRVGNSTPAKAPSAASGKRTSTTGPASDRIFNSASSP